MRENILEALARGEMIVGDGAFGTMLQAKGLPPGTIPEQWNRDNPEAVTSVHQSYLLAGAQILTANTFGGNRPRLQDAGLADDLEELNRLGIALAKGVAGDEAWVGASIGPTGQMLEPYGTLSLADAESIYAEQVAIVAEAGAHVLLLETHHAIEEACAAIRMAKRETTLPVFCTFAFNSKGRTMMGLSPEDAAKQAEEAGADVVGANCGEGPEAIRAALEGMRKVTGLPLMAQANAGIPRADARGQGVWDVTSEEMVEHVRTYISLGARVVGGCCGTDPTFIASMVAALRG